jgi:CBS domain containing-hemolysin-like protein
MGTIIIIVAITTMILINALYVAAEFATVSARKTRIKQSAEAGNRFAKILEPIMSDPRRLDTYVAACQLGITASSLVLGFYGQSAIARRIAPLLESFGNLQNAAAQSIAATVVLIGLTILQVLFGELLPKSIAIRKPEQVALFTVLPMRWSMFLFGPTIALFNGTGSLILRLLRVPAAGHNAHVHSPEEIELLVAESAKGGLLEADERQLLRNAFRVGELDASEVMVPRTSLVAAPLDTPLPKLLELVAESGYTRIPLYRETIDQIVGIAHLKDLFRLHVAGTTDVASVLRTVPFVPETKPAVEVWNLLQQENNYVAIVFDEFGGTAGMITMEDLLEEIFGELQDESDDEADLIAAGPDGRLRMRGDVLVDDVNEMFHLKLPSEDVNTIGGLVMAELEHTPHVGDEVIVGETALRVEMISGSAVREVSLQPPPNAELQLPGEFGTAR